MDGYNHACHEQVWSGGRRRPIQVQVEEDCAEPRPDTLDGQGVTQKDNEE